jgi:FkbM family methyltransferase
MTNMLLPVLGRKLSGVAELLQRPELVKIYCQGVAFRTYAGLHRPWLLDRQIRTVIDIGANTGQFARVISSVLPNAGIYSFEPVAECFKALTTTMSGHKHFRAFQVALGESNCTKAIKLSSFSPSSSFLPMAGVHKEEYTYATHVADESVVMKTLDDCVSDLPLQDNVLVKIDVQGYEDKVIAGGRECLQRASVVIVETSMEALYEGQPVFRDIFLLMDALGFRFQGSLDQVRHSRNGRVLFSDSIFSRS